MHNDVDAVAVRPNNKDLPSKNRVWGFRTPARDRIRKSAAQAAESRQENAPTPTNIASGIRYFLLTDQVGTLRAVADTSGAIVKRIDYDSFGNIVADSNPAFSVPFGFAGGLHDRDTGLVRFGYRDYSPELGRFVAKDPIDFAGGDTNLYAYAISDPINFIDPLGLDSLIYDRGTGMVQHLDNDGNVVDRFPARSGPFGNGALPPGNYTLPGPPVAVPPEHPRQQSYCDQNGNCWWQPITPQFETDRSGLGMHPDGGRPGTEGCVGATDRDTTPLRDLLRDHPRMPLEVR